MNTNLILRFMLVLALGGCATTSTQPADSELKARVYENDVGTVFSNAVRAAECQEWRIVSTDREGGKIQANTSVSMRSWGEKVEIVIATMENGKVRVDVVSRASLQIVSWGKNTDNIIDFYESLDRFDRDPESSCPER